MTLGELREFVNGWSKAITDECEIKLSDDGNLRTLSLPTFVIDNKGEGLLVVEASNDYGHFASTDGFIQQDI